MANIKEIKKVMIDQNLSVIDLAKILNKTTASIYGKLSGRTNFNLKELKTIADFCNVDIKIFLD